MGKWLLDDSLAHVFTKLKGGDPYKMPQLVYSQEEQEG